MKDGHIIMFGYFVLSIISIVRDRYYYLFFWIFFVLILQVLINKNVEM